MSDPVTGEIGGQPVFLENAATEATLKQLVTAVALLNANMKKTKGGLAGQQEVEDQLKTFLEDLKKQEKNAKKILQGEDRKFSSLKRNTLATDDNTRSKRDNTRFTYMAGAGLRLLHQTTVGAVLGMTNVIRDLANMGDSATSAAGVFSHIPIIGSVLAGVFGAAAAAAENVYKSFLTASTVGANFSGSMGDMIRSASQAGLTFDQFSGIIAKNGESLALLAQGTGEGARRLAQLGKEIRNSGIADQLYRLGYSTEEINNGMAQFTGRLARAGALQGMTTQQIAKVTGEYLRDLDAVAKLTGKSKESLQAQEDARMRDAQYLTFRNKLDADGQKNLEILMKTIPEGMQEGAKEVLATGTATTKAGRDFLAFMNRSGRSLSDLNRVALRSGTITEQQIRSLAVGMQEEGKALAKSPIGQTAGLFIRELNDLIVAANQYAARQTDINKIITKQRKELKNNPPGLDAAAMAKLKQDIANISNQFNSLLISSGLLEQMIYLLSKYVIPFIMVTLVPAFKKIPEVIEKTVKPAFEKIKKFTDDYLIPAFTFVWDNFTDIAKAVGLAVGAIIAFKTVLATIRAKQTLEQGIRGMLGSSPANPMWVKDVAGPRPGGAGPGGAGPGDVDKDKDGKGKKGGKSGGRPGLIRGGLGAATVVISGAVLASEISDINERQKAGEITKEEAGKEKTVATTGAVGAAGGGIGGMYAGAAIGTMIAGPIGTVVGGLIFGALGAWLGGKGGTAIGESITKGTESAVESNKAQLAGPSARQAVDNRLRKLRPEEIMQHPAYKNIHEEELKRARELVRIGRETQRSAQIKAEQTALERTREEIRKELEQAQAQPTAPSTATPSRPDSRGGTGSDGTRSNANRGTNTASAAATSPTPPTAGMLSSKLELVSAITESRKAQEAAAEARRAKEEEEKRNKATPPAAQTRSMSPQERLESLISTLNTSIDTLVGLNIRSNSILNDQLAVQRRIGNNNLMRPA